MTIIKRNINTSEVYDLGQLDTYLRTNNIFESKAVL
jgi:hypothetical protein